MTDHPDNEITPADADATTGPSAPSAASEPTFEPPLAAGTALPPAGVNPTLSSPTTPTASWTPYGGTTLPPPPPVGTTWPPSVTPPPGTRSRLFHPNWIVVAVVAALIGAGVGAGVTKYASNNTASSPTITVNEGRATAGPALLSGDVSIPALVKKVLPAVVSIDVKSEQEEDEGTGMIISSNGLVITNNHVIEDSLDGGTITVTQSGSTKAQSATLVGYDVHTDLALLKINNVSGLPTVTFGDSKSLVVGDAVVAIGNALGLAAGTPTVTQGIISALGRTVTASDASGQETLTNLIQTDAAINSGNSGGPLIDTAGQVIAMNTAVASSGGDNATAQNIGFAIPVSNIEPMLGQLEKGNVVSGGGYLGVDITSLTPQLRQQYAFTPMAGAVVLDVVPNSPAAAAGIQEGDVIVAVDYSKVTSAADLQTIIQNDKAGQRVTVSLWRGDAAMHLKVTLGSGGQEQAQANEQSDTQ